MEWSQLLEAEQNKPYYNDLQKFVNDEYKTKTIYPPRNQIMNALNLTPYDNVKCVILGQDPYHGANQAMGLSFSVNPGIEIPRSLQNIYKELNRELNCYIPNNGDLTPLAKQGVLLLNSVLTVQAKTPASHQNKGWENYTDKIISILNQKSDPIVFMLWGSFAKSKKPLITNPSHLILESVHPSPFSADKGFFGCNHFIKCNDFLKQHNCSEINWQISNL